MLPSALTNALRPITESKHNSLGPSAPGALCTSNSVACIIRAASRPNISGDFRLPIGLIRVDVWGMSGSSAGFSKGNEGLEVDAKSGSH